MSREDYRVDYRVVAEGLNRSVADLVLQLLPHGHREGNTWRAGGLADDPGDALSVILHGNLQGRWKDFRTMERGDALDLVAQCKFHGDKLAAAEWAQDWLRLPRQAPQQRLPARGGGGAVSQASPLAWAKRIWGQARLLRGDDPAWRYLRDRGIDFGRLQPTPRALRCHPALWNSESQRAWPALVAAITDDAGALMAVHRTWLEVDAFCADKAPLASPKKVLGGYRGGSIKLWPGASGTPWDGLAPGEIVMVGEGVEDTLSAAQMWPQWRAICAVSLGAMLGLDLPKHLGTIVLLMQNDLPGSPARKVQRQVRQRWLEQGHQVRVCRPPGTMKDWNDLALWVRRHRLQVAIDDWGSVDDRSNRGGDPR